MLLQHTGKGQPRYKLRLPEQVGEISESGGYQTSACHVTVVIITQHLHLRKHAKIILLAL